MNCRALSVSWRLDETWLSGRRVSGLRCVSKLKPKPSTHRRTTMKIMVGIDLHSNNALCGLMDESGRRLVHQKLPCDLAALLQLPAPYKESIATIAVESTFNWYWLVDGLQDHGYRVVLANPARMQPYSGMKYTDDVSDAYFLAELLRLNLLPTGHIHDRKTRPVRDLLRRRLLLVRQRTMLILSFKSLNERTRGQRVSLARVKAMKVEEAQARFSAPADPLLSGTEITLMGHLTAAITKLEQHLLGGAGNRPTYQRLQELPGIGKILGLTIALETGDAPRFADAGNFASYCRCVKSLRTSNGKKKGHLTAAITKLEQHLLGVAGKWPTCQRLQELPGIGKILGLTIALETGSSQRFADAGNFASYCRCVKSLRTSNGKKKGENNRKCGNKYLAWAFVEAAHFACRYDDQCRRFYDRKKQQTNQIGRAH